MPRRIVYLLPMLLMLQSCQCIDCITQGPCANGTIAQAYGVLPPDLSAPYELDLSNCGNAIHTVSTTEELIELAAGPWNLNECAILADGVYPHIANSEDGLSTESGLALRGLSLYAENRRGALFSLAS